MTATTYAIALLLAPEPPEPAPRSFEGPAHAPTQEDAADPNPPTDDPAAQADGPATPDAPAAAPPPPATDALERRPSPTVATRSGSPKRRGFAMSLSTGIGSCSATLCADVPALGAGRLEIGSRLGMVEFFGGVTFGGASIDVADIDGRVTLLDSGGGFKLFPIREGTVDPWAGVMVGYVRVAETTETEEAQVRLVYSRGVVRPSVGIGFAVHEHFFLGPRFDVDLGFAGEVCTRTDHTNPPAETDAEDETCSEISKTLEAGDSKLDDRLIRRELPRPWILALEVRAVF